MAKKSVLELDKPGLFSSAQVRRVLDDSGAVSKKNFQELVETNVASTSSFQYDPPFVGIRSTQQINTDFSRFENHTFFNSAEVNVNVAFDRIINEYPFDGTRKEIEAFLDSLTGFEKYVFDSFPTNKGYLNFDGSSYITVRDFAGSTYPNISKNTTGETIIAPGVNDPFTVEMQLYVNPAANGDQVVCQKISGSQQGITLGIRQSTSPTACDIVFGITSGSRNISVSAELEKGRFNHICATFDRRENKNKALIYVNEELITESSASAAMNVIDFAFSPLTIATGTQHEYYGGSTFTPTELFSGSIDEFRVWHSARSIKQQSLFAKKNVYQTPELKLYFKFNEPTGSIGTDDIVLDSAGNSLHSRITNFSYALRSTGSIANPMQYENIKQNPVLFPAYSDVQNLNSLLLTSASNYDSENPNLITRLVPNHYFLEGQVFEALGTEDGTIGDALDAAGPPGSLELGSAQLMASFMYVWAKFFDEIKMMIDLFGSTLHVDYDKHNFIADQFLPFLAKYYGFDMPAFFVNASTEQFVDSENIGAEVSTNSLSLRYVQNQLWRRILTNIGEIVRSKGTIHSIRTLFRSMGIDPDSNFRIREFGGPTKRSLEDSRDTRADITTFLNFSGVLAPVDNPETVDTHGVHASLPFLRSPFLSGSRVEPGYPYIKGAFVKQDVYLPHGISNEQHDGLFTSGSWTYEAMYRWPLVLTGSHSTSQSLVRMNITGSSGAPAGSGGLIMNLLAVSGSKVTLYASPSNVTPPPILELALTGVNVMDGRLWNISFGRQRNDEIGSHASASYFLRAARSDFGNIVESHLTSTFFYPSDASLDMLQNIDSASNSSGPFLTIGSQSLTQGIYLNDVTASSDFARCTKFSGHIGQIRFWSRALSSDEWFEHVRNPRSVGVDDPLTNFNFVKTASGSFGRLRIDASAEQPISKSNDAGRFDLFDFSQNNLHLTGSGFGGSNVVLTPERIFFSQLSPRFDEASTNNKVRVRSFKSYKNVQMYGGEIAPVYEIPREESPNDDVRFAIDFSVMDALNEDMVRMFSSFDSFDNVLGNPELVFSHDYPSLEDLRDIYFNRLTDKVRLRRFFEFFKWFDSILGISHLIEQLVPKKTNFLGTNFVVESHMLERPKFCYEYADIYLGENDRHGLKGTILLQQFAAILRRY